MTLTSTTALLLAAAAASSVQAFQPLFAGRPSTTLLFSGPEIGAGGMADTRNPDAMVHEDPRKSISAAPSFEEYLKSRSGGDAAPAPVAAAPVPAPAAPAPVPPPAAPLAVAAAAPVASSGGCLPDDSKGYSRYTENVQADPTGSMSTVDWHSGSDDVAYSRATEKLQLDPTGSMKSVDWHSGADDEGYSRATEKVQADPTGTASKNEWYYRSTGSADRHVY